MFSFFDHPTRFTQLLEREGPNNSSLITLSTKNINYSRSTTKDNSRKRPALIFA